MRHTDQPPDDEILRYEIIRQKKKKPKYYRNLANSLDYKNVKDMTYLAIKHKNLEAVMGLLKSNVYAATDALDSQEGLKFFSEKSKEASSVMPELYFFIRSPVSEEYKAIFRRLARQSIIRTSLKITSKGLKGSHRKLVPYYKPGMAEFDLDETIQHNPLKVHNNTLTYDDIFGIKRMKERRKVVMVLDCSGSMYGRLLLNAALTTSVLAYNMDKEHYSIVLFNSTAMVMKKMDETKPINNIIDEILDSEAVGFTNIHIGLKKGLEELKKIKHHQKNQFGILITDGAFNRGKNPLHMARKYPTLHVIGMPAENDAEQGMKTCKKIAEVGKGKFYAVKNYHEIPRALIKLLSQA
ncbi:MAG: VWA domain-containing protein [Promethearchaeia archaeon]